jgi:hypothetical protein
MQRIHSYAVDKKLGIKRIEDPSIAMPMYTELPVETIIEGSGQEVLEDIILIPELEEEEYQEE